MTGFGIWDRGMGFFLKIEFDAWLISSTMELTRVQILGRLRASLWDAALCLRLRHTPNN